MDYRDFAEDGNAAGIIARAESFIDDGDALEKGVVIGVELTENTYDHVTFYEEDICRMEEELNKTAWHYAERASFQGLAIHNYSVWKEKLPTIRFIEPDGVDDDADESYTIQWTDHYAHDDAQIAFYYDTDARGGRKETTKIP